MLMNGKELHLHSCPFLGMDRLAWKMAVNWFDAMERQDPPLPYLQVPMWFVSAFEVIKSFREMQEATNAA